MNPDSDRYHPMTMVRPEHRHHFARLRELGGASYQAYLDDGYREWLAADPERSNSHRSPYLLQKAIIRDGVKLFYVNVWVYDFSRFDRGDMPPVSYQPEVQFNSHSDQDPTFNVTYLGDDRSPEVVEEFFLEVYYRMDCGPYDNEEQ